MLEVFLEEYPLAKDAETSSEEKLTLVSGYAKETLSQAGPTFL